MATANGTVTFEACGKSRSLRFTTNALCLLEQKTGSTILAISGELQFGVSMETLRAMIWAASGDKEMTLSGAGDLIDDIGIAAARQLAIDAFEAAFPEPEAGDDADENPPKAAG